MNKWVDILLNCIWIMNIYCLPNSISNQDGNQDFIPVELLEHHLHKRSSSSNYDIALKFIISSKPVILRLQQNAQLNSRIPLFVIGQNGSVIREPDNPDSQKTDYYYDISNGAAFYIQSHDNSKTHMYGTFYSGGEEYILEYKNNMSSVVHKETQKPSNVYNFKIWKTPTKKRQQIDEEIHSNFNKPFTLHRRHKRAPAYHVELLFVVDYSIYKYWYDTSTATTQTQKDTDAKNSIKQFYAFVINGMDARYRSISPSFMSIVFAGVIISETQASSPWTETLRVNGFVNAHEALNKFSNWVKKQTDLPSNDHVMLLTRYSLSNGQSSNLEGYAFVGAICTSDSQSIMEESEDYIMFTVAAHELGHSLGAHHDGDKNNCKKDDFYIMAASSNPKLGSPNPWRFSSCSVNYFQNTIRILDGRKNNCLTSFGPSYNPNALGPYSAKLPGELYTADQQCERVFGSGSSMCREHYKGDFTQMCGLMWCRVPNGNGACQGMVPGDGTLCASKHWCTNGVCSYSNRAAATPDRCAHGDYIGTVEGRRTCEQLVTADKTECYRDWVSLSCCASCNKVSSGVTDSITTKRFERWTNKPLPDVTTTEFFRGCFYGDRIPSALCNKTACPYYDQEKVKQCCHTCAAYFTVPSDKSLPTESDGANEILIGVSVAIVIIAVICGVFIYRKRRTPGTGARKPLSARNGKEKVGRPSKPPPRKPLSSITKNDGNVHSVNSANNLISLPTLNSHTNKNLNSNIGKPGTNLKPVGGISNGGTKTSIDDTKSKSHSKTVNIYKPKEINGRKSNIDVKSDQKCLHNRSPIAKRDANTRRGRNSSSDDSKLLSPATQPDIEKDITKPATTIKDRIAALNTHEPSVGKSNPSAHAIKTSHIPDNKTNNSSKTPQTSLRPKQYQHKPAESAGKTTGVGGEKKPLRPPGKSGIESTNTKEPLRPPQYKPIVYGKHNSDTKNV